jgi:hypothetical protein
MRADLERRLARLEASRARLEARLRSVDAAALNRAPRPGAWSAGQAVEHVVNVEAGTLRYIRRKMQGGVGLPRAPLLSRLRAVILRFALASPLRFRAPAVVAEVPPHVDLPALLARWAGVRSDWRALLESFPAELAGRLVFRHGFVGLMALDDTLDFLGAHLEHHARQAERALAVSG